MTAEDQSDLWMNAFLRLVSAWILVVLACMPLRATDLFLGTDAGSCHMYKSTLTRMKYVIKNSSSEGGGPFDSENTTLNTHLGEMGDPQGAGTMSIVDEFQPFPIYVGLKRGVEVPEEKTCVWDGQTLSCNIGTLLADEEIEIHVTFMANQVGDFVLEAEIAGDLFDPVPANNRQSVQIDVADAGTRLLYPWISNNEGQFESILVANNFGSEPAEVTLTASRREGDPEMVQRTIPAGGSLVEAASSLFAQLGSGSGYSVLLQSDQSQLSGNWVTNNLVTGTGRSPSQGVAVSLPPGAIAYNERMGRDILFGYLPVSQDLTSAPVIVNLGSGPADVILRFYNGDGHLVGEDSETLRGLQPFRPFATVANNLVADPSEDLYLIASVNRGTITGVAFIFNSVGEPAIANARGVPRL